MGWGCYLFAIERMPAPVCLSSLVSSSANDPLFRNTVKDNNSIYAYSVSWDISMLIARTMWCGVVWCGVVWCGGVPVDGGTAGAGGCWVTSLNHEVLQGSDGQINDDNLTCIAR